MRRRTLIACLLFLATSATVEAGDKEAATVNNLRWRIEVEPCVAEREAIKASVRLQSPATPRQRNWLFIRTGGAAPYLVLVDERGKERRHAFDVIAGEEKQLHRLPPHAPAVSFFHPNLLQVFGNLSPGAYRLRAVLPKVAYEIQGMEGYQSADIASAEVTFTVERATIEAARKANAPTDDVVLQFERRAGDVTHGSITNNTTSAISITAYVEARDPATLRDVPLTMPVLPEVFRGPRGWMRKGATGWCGVGLGTVIIAPGQSQLLQLSSWPGAGILRYRVRYQVLGKPEAPERYAVSAAVDFGTEEQP